MKVVLFCGGLGLRLRDYSQKTPKPLVPIGKRPILWHIMKYYAHQGHNDFILCLGYKAEDIKSYFLGYEQNLSNDFVLSNGGKTTEPIRSDIEDWRITFIDTGLTSNIGQRLKMVRSHLEGEEYFLANYSDTLTDAPMNDWIDYFKTQNKVASVMCVKPHLSLHAIALGENNLVTGIHGIRSSILINGGHFVFRQDIFDYIDRGEELVEEPFERLIKEEKLLGHHYEGFWATMDTFKDRQNLEELHSSGRAPWEVWKYRRGDESTRYANAGD